MHYLIHIPGVRGPDPKHLERVGLADHIAGADFMECAGPTGPGVMCAWRSPDAMQFNYLPDQQYWLPAAASGDLAKGRYHVGIWKESPPTPVDLRRSYPYRGASTELGDGNSWVIPFAAKLPADAMLNDDGTWKFVLQQRFHTFWLEALEWARKASESEKFFYSASVDFLTRALALNYRITPEVASRLRLFSDHLISDHVLITLGE